MKLIPPIFEKVLSKEQVAANVSVARCDRADHWQKVTHVFSSKRLFKLNYIRTSTSIKEKAYKA